LKLNARDIPASTDKLGDQSSISQSLSIRNSVHQMSSKSCAWSCVSVLSNRELLGPRERTPAVASHTPSVRSIELALPEGLLFEPGDHIALYGENNSCAVDKLLARLKLGPQTLVCADQCDGLSSLLIHPHVSTSSDNMYELRDLLLHTMDLNKPFQKLAIQNLPDELQQSVVQATMNHMQKYHGTQPSGLEILLGEPSIELTVVDIFSLFPAMKPRYYSIASSLSANPNSISICVNVAETKTASGYVYKGIASNHLKGLTKATTDHTTGSNVWISIRKNPTFRLPSPGRPIIMVGAGSGIAPFMGFLQELRARQQGGAQKCPAYLFFGCRNPDSALYTPELESFQADGTLTSLHVAFSRHGKKKYVQDDLELHSATVWQLLHEGACVFVCGDASRMAPDVCSAFERIAGKEGAVDGAKYMKEELIGGARFYQDVWPSNA